MLLFFTIYFVLVNAISFGLMYSDKQKSKQKSWRIPESNLLFFCLVGGFIGTFLAMKYIRHKTQHWQFHTSVVVAALFWLLLLPFSYYTFIH